MSKLCAVCGTDNRDEAQFCRACGTPSPTSAPAEPPVDAGTVCDECGFQNQPGQRYCAKCGVSLLGTVIVPRPRAGTTDHDQPTSPPPISYPSYAPVAPYPPAPAGSPSYPPVGAYGDQAPAGDPTHYDDPLRMSDVAGAAAGSAQPATYGQAEADDAAPTAPRAATPAVAGSRSGLIVGIVVLALLIVGAAAWWFMGRHGAAVPPVGAAASAASAALDVPAATPVVTPPAPSVVEAASEPAAAVAPTAPEPAASLPESPPAVQAGSATRVDADAESRRVAAEKRRERIARERAEREVKAKAAVDQQRADQDRAATAARAEQEATARRRAEEAQRRSRAVAPPPATQPAQPRGVREICAGRGAIAEAICQSRECASTEHANEPLCRQKREADERRRNYQG